MASKKSTMARSRQGNPLLRELLSPGTSSKTDWEIEIKTTPVADDTSLSSDAFNTQPPDDEIHITPAQEILLDQLLQKHQRLQGLVNQQQQQLQRITKQLELVKARKLDSMDIFGANTTASCVNEYSGPTSTSTLQSECETAECSKQTMQRSSPRSSQPQPQPQPQPPANRDDSNTYDPPLMTSTGASRCETPLQEFPLNSSNSKQTMLPPLPSASVNGALEKDDSLYQSPTAMCAPSATQSLLGLPEGNAARTQASPYPHTELLSQIDQDISMQPSTSRETAQEASSLQPSIGTSDVTVEPPGVFQSSTHTSANGGFCDFPSAQRPSEVSAAGSEQQDIAAGHSQFPCGNDFGYPRPFQHNPVYDDLLNIQGALQKTADIANKQTPKPAQNFPPFQHTDHLDSLDDSTRNLNSYAKTTSQTQDFYSGPLAPLIQSPITPLASRESSRNVFNPAAGVDFRLSEQLLKMQLMQHQLLLRQQVQAMQSMRPWSLSQLDNFSDDPWLTNASHILGLDPESDVNHGQPHVESDHEKDLMLLQDYIQGCSFLTQKH